MRNVKYIVKFVVNPMLDDEFDFKDEALAWAEEHLSEKPVVTAIDVEYPDEFGAEPIIYDSEEIFHYAAEEHPDEDKVDNAEKLSDLDNRLADLEAELDMPELTPEEEAEWEAQMEKEEEDRKWGEACMYDADEFDGHENLTESANVVSEIKKNSKFKDLRDATISKFIELYIDDTGAEKSEVKAEDVIEWVDDPLQVLFDFSDDFNGLAAVDIVMKDPKAIKVCKKLCDENNVFDPIDGQDKEEPTDEEVVNYFIKEGTSVNDAIDLLSKEYKKLDEDVILFDPFGCDFSECEPMEVCSDNHRADCCKDFNINAVDFFKELAAELGIADEVEISEISKSDDPEEDKNVYVNVDTENIDNDTQGKIADAVTDAIGEVVPEGTSIGTGVGDVNLPAEPAEPKPADEISEISDEAKDPEDVVPEEVKANEEPNVEVQVEDEKPAEEISKCHACPECGKEICESLKDDFYKILFDGNYLENDKTDIICEKPNIDFNNWLDYLMKQFAEYKKIDLEDVKKDVLADEKLLKSLKGEFEALYDECNESVCPKCGKEICESKDYLVAYIDCSGSRLQKRDEDAKKAKDLGAKKIFYFSNYVDRKPDPEIIGYGGDFNYVAEHIRQNKFNNVVIFTDKDINSPIGDSLRQMPNVKILIEKLAKESVCKKCGNKELVEKNKVTHTTGDPAIGDAHFNGAFEGGEGCSENLEEEHHPEEPQPEVDLVKVGTDARKMAAAYGKPVIYGYEGPDHHGGKRYFEIDPIVCDDLNKCRDDVMKKYHPSGSILVAYPDQLDEANNCDKEDKMLFVEENEMTDKELAEKFYKALEEKHNCK